MRALVFSIAALVAPVAAANAQTSSCPAPVVRDPAPAARVSDAGLAALSAANRQARQRPQDAQFSAARQAYVYAPGAIYELHASPDYVSVILLESGETLMEAAAGDTSRWSLIETAAEGEDGGRSIVLVRPAAGGLRTNIVLVTSRRTYLIEAVSRAGDIYAAETAWCYPAAADPQVREAAPLNSAYRIRTVRGVRPAWTPVRVSDDGRRTWIEFAEGIEARSMPPLFVVTAEGDELVNYRVEGTRYVVDQVFDRAELRLASRSATIVRIERVASPERHERRRRRP